MKCFNCGANMAESAKFCPKCGADQGFSAELIARAANGDQQAMTELYNKTQSAVYYTIRSLIKDEDAVHDIMQETYIKAFKNLSQLETPEKFKAWIKRIAHNRSIDRLRQNKPILFSQMEGEDSDEPIDFEDTRAENLPEVVVDQNETARLLAQILDSLPEEQRVAVSMFYYEDYSVKEISEQLGVSENTVKSRLNYGRKKIEAKVRELEKHGTKLYGLAPIPFLLLLFKSQGAFGAPVSAALSTNILAACSGSAAVSSAGAASSASVAASSAGAAAGKAGAVGAVKSAVGLKIAAGVLAAGVAGGAAFGIVHNLNQKPEPVVSVVSAEQDGTDYSEVMAPLKSDLTAALTRDVAENNIYSGDWRSDTGIYDTTGATVNGPTPNTLYRLHHKGEFSTSIFYATVSGVVNANNGAGTITAIYPLTGLYARSDNTVGYVTEDLNGEFYMNETDAYDRVIAPLLGQYEVEAIPIS